MNNSNNNIFGDSNNTSLPQNGNSTGASLSPQSSNLVNSANSSNMNTNNVFDSSLIVNPTQLNQGTSSVQPQSNINSQMNNNISNNNINPILVDPLPTNNVNTQSTVQPNLNMNGSDLFQNSNPIEVNSTLQPSNSVNSANSSIVNTNNVLDSSLIINPTQLNQGTSSMQSQNNVNSQISNNGNINPIFVDPLPTNNVNTQSTMQSNLNMNGSDFSQNSNPIEVNSTLQPSNSVNNTNSSTVNTNYGFETNSTVNPIQQNQDTSLIQSQNNVNSQINNNVSNSNISSSSVSPLSANNVNQVDDGELLKAFIGNNYEKITTRSFNFAGFFFTTLYMFYRKMFGYGLLVFLLNFIVLNVINNFVVTLAFNVVVGLLVNKIYLSYAKKKIAVIKTSNSQKSIEELKSICSTKGGTSVGQIFLGLVAELGIAFVLIFVMTLIGIGSFIGGLFNFGNWNITTIQNGSKSGTLVENVYVNGYSCLGSKCSVTIENVDGNSEDYSLGIDNSDFFSKLGDYKDYIKLNIYYNQKGNDKTIVDYKIFLKSSDEDITSVKTENELRDKIGLYSIGTHTDSLTLKAIGTTGFGYDNDNSYTYTEYTFVDDKNNEYEMKYINNGDTLDLTEGQKYNVTFEVSEGTFDYEFTIKSIN